MKKIAPIVALAIIAASFASCKKDYTCTCKNSTTTFAYPLGKQKKKDADATCKSYSTTWALAGGSCSL